MTMLDLLRERADVLDNGCWIWRDSVRPDGYGQLQMLGRLVVAHRVAYVLRYGDLADDMQLHHVCETRRCINPDHLVPVRQAEHLRLHLTRDDYCRNGHPRTNENTYIRPNGQRECRDCWRERRAA